MAISSTRKLCRNLISLAIQRCRISNDLCRLSIVLKPSPESNPSLLRVSISDTGAGSSLAEFKCIDCASTQDSAETWDGMLSITTTSICDKEIHHYSLNFKATVATRRLSRLPATPKNGRKFSGSEVSLTFQENIGDFVIWITHLCQKISILKLPKVAIELLVEKMNGPGSRCDHLLLAKDGILLPLSMPSIERLTSGLKDYVLKHGNAVDKDCRDCFSSVEKLKVGRGVACSGQSVKSMVQIVEAVIVVSEVPELSNPSCQRTCGKMTEVLCFHDFFPCSIPESSLNALTSIDWQSYGLTLISNAMEEDGHTILEWENLPPFTRIHIGLHSYHKEVLMPRIHKRPQCDRNLVKKAVKVALDDLKAKCTGLFLSSHALKIQGHAPDLSRAIAGLILSSNDKEFQGECAFLLGLQPADVHGEGIVESCIKEKIIGIVEMNDRKPKYAKDHALHLFEDNRILEEDYQDEEDEGANIMDL